MNQSDISQWQQLLGPYAIDVGGKLLAAIVFWVLGRWLIGVVGNLVQKALARQHVDATIMRYLGTVINVTLNIMLVVGILGYFGIQTTTFAALFAAAGVAIGMAWSGLLSNFAAGVFLIVLRPMKVGDFVSAGGVTGTVREIGLFSTVLNTPDNVLTMVGNGKILSDTIQNFSSNPHRRVELKAQLAGSADFPAAVAALQARLASIPNVLASTGKCTSIPTRPFAKCWVARPSRPRCRPRWCTSSNKPVAALPATIRQTAKTPACTAGGGCFCQCGQALMSQRRLSGGLGKASEPAHDTPNRVPVRPAGHSIAPAGGECGCAARPYRCTPPAPRSASAPSR